ncbi:hypothetical protein ACWFMI_02385 [Nocardiopsis terrae]
MPEIPDTAKRLALLSGAATLLLTAGCAQDEETDEAAPEVEAAVETEKTEEPQREYTSIPTDGELAWLVPEDLPAWTNSGGGEEGLAVFVRDGCSVTLNLMEGHAEQSEELGREPQDSALLSLTVAGDVYGDDLTDTPITPLDPVEVPTDDGESVEFTAVETVNEETDAGSRAGVLWHGDDELRFVQTCGVLSGSWEDGQEDVDAFLDDLLVAVP